MYASDALRTGCRPRAAHPVVALRLIASAFVEIQCQHGIATIYTGDPLHTDIAMAFKATVYKAELQISDMDRHYYATHPLTLAQHPSETDQRLMVRVLAFALFADERLSFGRGLSSEDEPDLWRKSLTGEIEQWIDLGQPDESRIRKACGRARQVIVVAYGGRAFAPWWEKNAAALARCSNLSVIEIPAVSVEELAALIARNMSLQCMIQDREMQFSTDTGAVTLTPIIHRA